MSSAPLRRLLPFGFVFAVLGLLAAASQATARPAHRQALVGYFGPFLPPKLHDCRTCHVPDRPGQSPEDEKPHNAFGQRIKEVRAALRKAHKDPSIAAALETVADEDSDGDGVSNLLELLTGHSPGDPADKPSAAELEKVRTVTLPAFRKFLTGYQWRPFETVRRPPVPTDQGRGWGRNPIDGFIAAAHTEHDLTPRPEADRATLLRRVTIDLTGLPPTPEELHAFLADPSPDAYEKVVDRLLASPRYGERWGRHWMDVWRYSDWAGWADGKQIRDSQPHIWHWRDWIIESLNADRPYDQMVREMLAGDELAPDDPATLRATGYLVRNYKMLSREKWLQDTVDHTFLAFQGVTVGCARCHDHMFDPILQREYYQVRAVFEPHKVRIDRLPGEPDTKKDGLARAYDDAPPPTYLFIRGDDRTPDKSQVMEPGVPRCLGVPFPGVKPVRLPPGAVAPDRREFVMREMMAAAVTARDRARDALAAPRRTAAPAVAALLAPPTGGLTVCVRAQAARPALDAVSTAEVETALTEARAAALAAVERAERLEDQGKKGTEEWKQAATRAAAAQQRQAVAEAKKALHLLRLAPVPKDDKGRALRAKNLTAAEQALAKAELTKPPIGSYTPRPTATYPATSSGRRSAFAFWLTDRRNPLTARVAVNQIWMRHFCQPLVPSVFDFGRNGRPPELPALVDWLAAELMDHGWSMKHLHRLIVTSATYRQASTPSAEDLARDRDNLYFWRVAPRRLEAEAVRDQVLFVAGKLDLTMGGPDLDYALGLTVPRRSLYFRHAAEKQMEFLKLFDAASVTECYRRKESIVPQQALALANSDFAIRHARLLARDLHSRAGSDATRFVRLAFERVLSRPPTAGELSECVAFLSQGSAVSASQAPVAADPEGHRPSLDPVVRVRENLVQVLLNHHEFVTVR